RPLPLLIPLYAHARRAPLVVRAGLFIYDLLSFDKSLAAHRTLTRAEALKRAPGLATEALRGAAVYYDAQVEYAERLVLENALDATMHGASVLTYARVTRINEANGRVCGVEFDELLTGGSYRARAPIVINAAGPWVDEIAAVANPTLKRMIGGTKGSHIVVAPFASAPRDALYVEAQADARPFFIIPWHELYLIGTTDVRYAGDLDKVMPDEAEIAYLLNETNRVLPAAQLTRADVLYAYAGVRPLAYQPEGATDSITRRHFIHDHAPQLAGFISIVGGKLTTYRELARQAVNLIYKKLDRSTPACVTAARPLPGAAGTDFKTFSARFKAESTLPVAVNERLLRIYGTRAVEVLRLAADDASLRAPFNAERNALGAEVVFAFRAELAETLSDCLLRRTMVGLNGTLGLDAVECAAELAQKYLGWDDARAAREVADYRRYVERFQPR
ncbi:MAG TPA: glycerol-3-phosphate dehydrogenase/oxidase, partial [Pyrinomonadaceae bacterium]|nr:glycerol-3-phosphate dehydrogenase/oxidase [Pyrinomonadaceae bacterium]